MKDLLLAVICIVVVSLSACSQGQQSSTNKNSKTPSENTKQEIKKPMADPLAVGKKVYNTYCLTCHGQKGDMGASGAHDLTKTKLSVAESVKVITEGRGLMTPHKFLGDEKIKAVAKYIETFKAK